mmetsp:Transcript_46249/g.53309  ORF Transcript_46249/g.53309 Transcript_46249/m.53309 type:complete len:135 (+) Transcript_46249:469-873(+)
MRISGDNTFKRRCKLRKEVKLLSKLQFRLGLNNNNESVPKNQALRINSTHWKLKQGWKKVEVGQISSYLLAKKKQKLRGGQISNILVFDRQNHRYPQNHNLRRVSMLPKNVRLVMATCIGRPRSYINNQAIDHN